MSQRTRIMLAAAVLLVLWLLSATLYTVTETQQALLVRLGAPVAASTEPGLHAKVPFVDTVIFYDKRLLLLVPDAEQVILGDQKRLEVQPYTSYRIANPLLFYQALRTTEQASTQLTQLVSSSLRRELGQINLSALLSKDRARITELVQKAVAEKARSLGIEVVEVRFHRADLPLETSQSIYDRMKSERQREAKELRAQGFEWAQQIQSKADAERTVILSEAQRQAKITHGEADAEANRILAESFSKDPQFYKLYRSLQTYKGALADSAPTLVLSPDAEFLHSLKTGPGSSGKR
ncbi:protease modulator HflC [Andreprevotia chitinilytica]|uniref:protease modulator HflC n=1 Tax=Andreprevotia chitinilytica TaxID=396808 RepID=UPI00054E29B3|nr:protease modulator HflC [Andreprevotia chitinilytica]